MATVVPGRTRQRSADPQSMSSPMPLIAWACLLSAQEGAIRTPLNGVQKDVRLYGSSHPSLLLTVTRMVWECRSHAGATIVTNGSRYRAGSVQ
jgi:hypothetical protein